MPYTEAARNTAVAALKTAAAHISLHTADPGTSGASEVAGGSYSRQPTTWPTNPTSGSIQGSPTSISVPAGTTVTHWGIWTAASGGTFYYGDALRNGSGVATPEAFGSAGTQSITPSLSAIN